MFFLKKMSALRDQLELMKSQFFLHDQLNSMKLKDNTFEPFDICKLVFEDNEELYRRFKCLNPVFQLMNLDMLVYLNEHYWMYLAEIHNKMDMKAGECLLMKVFVSKYLLHYLNDFVCCCHVCEKGM